jgi:hypothetical protein
MWVCEGDLDKEGDWMVRGKEIMFLSTTAFLITEWLSVVA